MAGVGVRAEICHGEQTRAVVLEPEPARIVLELAAEDGLRPRARLVDESIDYPVEAPALEPVRLSRALGARGNDALLPRAKGPEVLSSEVGDVAVEGERREGESVSGTEGGGRPRWRKTHL